jgi:hypothetical protein
MDKMGSGFSGYNVLWANKIKASALNIKFRYIEP